MSVNVANLSFIIIPAQTRKPYGLKRRITLIKANIENQSLSLRFDEVISDSNRYLEIEFEYDSDWDDKTKIAVFKNDSDEFEVVLLDGNSMYSGNNKCFVPSEVIKAPYFSVSVYGIEGNVVVTTNEAVVNVTASGITNLEPAEPTPSIWNQLLNCINPLSRCPGGGTEGQVLQKDSDADYDMSWQDADSLISEHITSYFVPKTLKINNKSLSGDIVLDSTDIGAYPMPQNGIPVTDLSADVRASLSKANSAIQEHQSLDGKQDKLTNRVNIKSLNNQSLLGSGNIEIPATFSPVDEVIWRSPKNFGKKVGGTAGDNIKVYRDIIDRTLVFLGSGEMYGSDQYNDSYIEECICGNTNTSIDKIFIKNGITSIGKNVFNRFYSAETAYGYDKYWNVKSPSNNWNGAGVLSTALVLPPSVNLIESRAFQYCRFSDKIVINCEGPLTVGSEAFNGAGFITVEITNATSIGGYASNTFLSTSIRNFSISCNFNTSISFASSDKLTADSLINIANHLKTLSVGDGAQTLTLHTTAKTLCGNTKGTVNEGVFVKDANGSVYLTDFITQTKGWTLA
ncbi:MAG TPA: hypothetical protein DEW35_02740 [Ruminococcaceae bacterium]|nr:hypothetical protein [Oscillospiraceae bacterium]